MRRCRWLRFCLHDPQLFIPTPRSVGNLIRNLEYKLLVIVEHFLDCSQGRLNRDPILVPKPLVHSPFCNATFASNNLMLSEKPSCPGHGPGCGRQASSQQAAAGRRRIHVGRALFVRLDRLAGFDLSWCDVS